MLSAVYIYHSGAEQLYVYHVAAYNEQEVFNKIYLYRMTDIVFNLIDITGIFILYTYTSNIIRDI